MLYLYTVGGQNQQKQEEELFDATNSSMFSNLVRLLYILGEQGVRVQLELY